LQALNGITNKNKIYAGQTLKVTGSASKATYHTVKSGDNVSYLASKYGSSQSQFVKWNNLASADKIYIGQRLRVKELNTIIPAIFSLHFNRFPSRVAHGITYRPFNQILHYSPLQAECVIIIHKRKVLLCVPGWE